ncbi:60S ribosomal protein L27 [Gracilaria domingensis]|nr:60S ribosomal protein L27 [Gracilaria domingensis]
MPTRYTLDIETVKGDIDIAAFSSPGANADRPEARKESRAVIKKEFQQRYNAGKNRCGCLPLHKRAHVTMTMPHYA